MIVIIILLSVSIALNGLLVYAVWRHQKWTFEQLTAMRENDKIISKNQSKIHQEIINIESNQTKMQQSFSKDLSKLTDSINKSETSKETLKYAQDIQRIKNDVSSIKRDVSNLKK